MLGKLETASSAVRSSGLPNSSSMDPRETSVTESLHGLRHLRGLSQRSPQHQIAVSKRRREVEFCRAHPHMLSSRIMSDDKPSRTEPWRLVCGSRYKITSQIREAERSSRARNRDLRPNKSATGSVCLCCHPN